MNDTLHWLLDLERVGLEQPGGVSLQWLRPLDNWLWFLVLCSVSIYIAMIYRREGGRLTARILLAALRAGLIVLVIVLLTRPVLVLHRDREEPSTVAVLLDTSASMARVDAYPPAIRQQLAELNGAGASPPTRWQIASAILKRGGGEVLRGLLEHHHLRVFEFAGSASTALAIRAPEQVQDVGALADRESPNGPATHIARAIEQVFAACMDAHLTAIVLITDGRASSDADWDKIVRLAQAQGTPIYAVPLGSPDPVVDLAMEEAAAESHVYVSDEVVVDYQLESSGLEAPQSVHVVLREASGRVVAEQELTMGPANSTHHGRIAFQPSATGRHSLVIQADALPQELQTRNNAQALEVTVVDDKIRVLYVDGYPRFEYRYLKNTLLREPTMISSCLLLSADENFVQEGTEPIRRFPDTLEELAAYDVIVFGDVDPRGGWLSGAQAEMIVEFVRNLGGGFALIAGEHSAPERFFDTPLEALVPVLRAPVSGSAAGGPFHPQLTAAGREHVIFETMAGGMAPGELLDRLPPWYWSHPGVTPRPGAEVLLEHPFERTDERPLPIVVTGSFGAGRVLFQGSDDTWRWRRHRGEAFFDAYWIQTLRYLGRSKKFRTQRDMMLLCQPKRLAPDQPLAIGIAVEDEALAAGLPDSLEVTIRDAGGEVVGRETLARLANESRRFRGTHLASGSGSFEITFDPQRYGVNAEPLRTRFNVSALTLEDAVPQADHELLARLANATGGEIVEPWKAGELPGRVPQREYVVPDDINESIWDSKLTLIFFTCLITAEWVVRKICGLP